MTEDFVTGKIIKLSEEGWGFITSKDIPFTRIFFHWTALVQNTRNFKDLETNMNVKFKVAEIPDKGYRAIKISVIEKDKNDESPEVPTLHGNEPSAN